MKRILLAALAATTLAAPASAQYYGGPYSAPQWYEPTPSYRYEPRREYYYEQRRPDYYYEQPREVWRRPVRRTPVGNICVTSRGSCEYPQYFQIQTPCRCEIPGFVPKRGAILQ